MDKTNEQFLHVLKYFLCHSNSASELLKKRIIECLVWSVALYAAETWTCA